MRSPVPVPARPQAAAAHILTRSAATFITRSGQALHCNHWQQKNHDPPHTHSHTTHTSTHLHSWVPTQVYLPMSYCYGKRATCQETDLTRALREELYPVPYHTIDWNGTRNKVAKEDLYYPHPFVQVGGRGRGERQGGGSSGLPPSSRVQTRSWGPRVNPDVSINPRCCLLLRHAKAFPCSRFPVTLLNSVATAHPP